MSRIHERKSSNLRVKHNLKSPSKFVLYFSIFSFCDCMTVNCLFLSIHDNKLPSSVAISTGNYFYVNFRLLIFCFSIGDDYLVRRAAQKSIDLSRKPLQFLGKNQRTNCFSKYSTAIYYKVVMCVFQV